MINPDKVTAAEAMTFEEACEWYQKQIYLERFTIKNKEKGEKDEI